MGGSLYHHTFWTRRICVPHIRVLALGLIPAIYEEVLSGVLIPRPLSTVDSVIGNYILKKLSLSII